MPESVAACLDRASACDPAALPGLAVALAAAVLREAEAGTRRAEAREAARLSRLMDDPPGRAFTTALADRAFRSARSRAIARQFTGLVDRFGVPLFLGPLDRLQLVLGRVLAPLAPGLIAPALLARLRHDAAQVILPGESRPLHRRLRRRKTEGVTLNVNRLGEAILGEEEADQRREQYRRLLGDPLVDFVSIKISSITSRVLPAAFERCVAHLAERLEPLLVEADRRSAMINLDMEEYRDLALTIATLQTTLARPAHARTRIGVAIQGYLPDSLPVLQELTAWAQGRVAAGGAPLKVRLVKGANLAMERVEAALHGWRPATFADKAAVDANYKRLLRWALRPEHAAAVQVGVASHNLFDVAYALLLRRHHGVEGQVELEMLEGMAPALARAACRAAGGLLLYAPAVEAADFRSAIAYLMRRLDENTTPGNYLAASFGMRVGSPAWIAERDRFLAACAAADAQPAAPPVHRRQDRGSEAVVVADGPFVNDAETDWCQAANRRWAAVALAARLARDGEILPLHIAGSVVEGRELLDGVDPSRPGAVPYRHAVARGPDLDRALTAARRAASRWRGTAIADRRALLRACAVELRRARGALLAACVVDGGKTVVEADPEVSEAIDFAEYYARAFDDPDLVDGLAWQGLGVVLVAPPWNFPVSIPTGGILAALMAGNAVVFKPAPEAVLCGAVLSEALYAAGVAPDLLQFLPCRNEPEGQRLIRDPRVDAVVLTGASSTAERFLRWRPDLYLLAETGGKNAIVVAASADRDQAVKDLVASAFGHAGQKCSACSLAICVAEVYDDPAFRRQLRDAAASLAVGSAHDPWHRVTPLIRPPGAALQRALTSLDAGQQWLLEPRPDPENPRLWSPGIVLGVRPDDFLQQTECFGPVLGVLRARDLDEAVRLQNHVVYGLTGGLQALDEDEQRFWAERVAVGNAYINRSITGAVVERQAFGGWKRSCFGPGAKAGGPHYVLRLARARSDGLPRRVAPVPDRSVPLLQRAIAELPEQAASLQAAAGSGAWAWRQEFSPAHDHGVAGEVDLLRYRRVDELWVRIDRDDEVISAIIIVLALRQADVRLHLSLDPTHRGLRWLASASDDTVTIESTGTLAERLAPQGFAHLRWPRPADRHLLAAAHRLGVPVIRGRPTLNGRLELLACLREQSLSHAYHRYGNTSLGSPFATDDR